MARPRGKPARPRSTAAVKSKGHESWPQKLTQAVLAWFTGPAGQQILALTLIGLGAVTFITLIPGVNSGALIGAWIRALVFAFGWAAYPVAATITALGLLWLRHLVHRVTTWRWRPFLGFELALIGLQTLTYSLISQHSWRLVESGKGGGVIGWALYLFFSDYFGPLITGIFMALIVVLGIALAFDLTRRDLQVAGHRISEVGQAWQAQRASRRAARHAAHRARESQVSTYGAPPRQRIPNTGSRAGTQSWPRPRDKIEAQDSPTTADPQTPPVQIHYVSLSADAAQRDPDRGDESPGN